MNIGQMQDLESLPTRLLRRRQRIRLRLRKPSRKVQRRYRRKRTQSADEVLAEHLTKTTQRERKGRSGTRVEKSRDWEGTHLPIEASHIRIRDNLRDDRADSQYPEHGVTITVELELVTDRDCESRPLLGRGHGQELGDFECGLAFRAV